MTGNFQVVLDTCVLTPMPLADLLLRLAEEPRLYLPVWSPDILAELERTPINKFRLSPAPIRLPPGQDARTLPGGTHRRLSSAVTPPPRTPAQSAVTPQLNRPTPPSSASLRLCERPKTPFVTRDHGRFTRLPTPKSARNSLIPQ